MQVVGSYAKRIVLTQVYMHITCMASPEFVGDTYIAYVQRYTADTRQTDTY